jgi:hypothetical protein
MLAASISVRIFAVHPGYLNVSVLTTPFRCTLGGTSTKVLDLRVRAPAAPR